MKVFESPPHRRIIGAREIQATSQKGDMATKKNIDRDMATKNNIDTCSKSTWTRSVTLGHHSSPRSNILLL